MCRLFLVLTVIVILLVHGMLSTPCRAADLPAPSPDEIRAFCIDFNWGPGGPNGFAGPGVWADASPEEHVAWYEALGCNVLQTFAVSTNGYAWYKGGVVPPQPGLARDFLPEVVRLAHARGMRVMGYFCVGANTRWGAEHPALSYGTPSAPHIPFSREYLDFLAGSIEDALRKTGMDGFMIDWLWNPGDWNLEPLRWLDCEKRMYRELFGEPFPEVDGVSPERALEFRRRAIDRAWDRIRTAAKGVRSDAVIWLSVSDVNCPTVTDSKLFREVDWLMNEATDPAVLARVERMKGPETRLVQCVVGWGDRHDARGMAEGITKGSVGIYGFAAPGANSLPLAVSVYRSRSPASFGGNDRNIAILSRLYAGLPLDPITLQRGDGVFDLVSEAAGAKGMSPVIQDGQVGHWGNVADSVLWTLDVARPGRFSLGIEYAAEKGGSSFSIEVAGRHFDLVSEETGSWRNYRAERVGEIELEASGRYIVSVVPSTRTPWQAVSLRRLRLDPLPGVEGEAVSRAFPQALGVRGGVFSMEGHPYRAIGVNHPSLFTRLLEDPTDGSGIEGMRTLARAGIPFARFWASGFWPREWKLWLTDREEHFRRLDRVVRAAEEAGFGLVPSLFWHYPIVPDLVGEPVDQLCNPESKTLDFIRNFTEEVVLRYRDSPAIWGWEMGNEYTLSADLPNAADQRPPAWPTLGTPERRTERDELTSAAAITAFIEFARTVRCHDPRRFISSGNAAPRDSAWHNSRERSWTLDTPEQFAEVLLRDNPDPMDVLSIHLYPGEREWRPGGIAVRCIEASARAARTASKPLFVGEFGAGTFAGMPAERAVLEEWVAAFLASDVPLAAFWAFDYPPQESQHLSASFANRRAWVLGILARANEALRGRGAGVGVDGR